MDRYERGVDLFTKLSARKQISQFPKNSHYCFSIVVWCGCEVHLKCKSQQKKTRLSFFVLFSYVTTSPTSGTSPTPQPPRSGPLTPTTHHAALPAASSSPSGSGPPPTHFHHHSSSLGHSHSSACRWACRWPHSPQGSRLHERHGITGPYGNNTNVVTWERRSRLPSNQNTHPVSLFLLSVFLCVFLFIWPRGGQADSCTSSDTEVGMLQLWVRKLVWSDEGWMDMKNGRQSKLVLPTCLYYQIVMELA